MSDQNKRSPWYWVSLVLVIILLRGLSASSIGASQSAGLWILFGLVALLLLFLAGKAFTRLRQYVRQRLQKRKALRRAYQPLVGDLFQVPWMRWVLFRGVRLFESNKNTKAFQWFHWLLRRELQERERAILLFLCACCAMDDGQNAFALQGFEMATRIWSGLQPAWSRLATLYRLAGDREKSDSAYRHAIRLRPQAGDVYLDYAIALLHWRQAQQAMPLLQQARDLVAMMAGCRSHWRWHMH